MIRPAVALSVCACLASCRAADPSWAAPGVGVAGDGTVSGEPAVVKRVAAPPAIDGRLDEDAWSTATVLGPFVDAGEGRFQPDHPVAATARVLWDERHLYVGVIVRDRAPKSPFPRDALDPALWTAASAIELMLQPGDPRDNRDYFELQVDTSGAVFDTRWDDYNTPISGEGDKKTFGHADWSSRIERAAYVHRGSFYCVELALPFESLRGVRSPLPPRAGDIWRLNLYSFRDGQRLSQAWSPIRKQGNFHRSSRFGRIRFE